MNANTYNSATSTSSILAPYDIFNDCDLYNGNQIIQELNNYSSVLRDINKSLWTNTNSFNWTSLLNTYVLNNSNSVVEQQFTNECVFGSGSNVENAKKLPKASYQSFTYSANQKENQATTTTTTLESQRQNETKFQRSFAEVVAKTPTSFNDVSLTASVKLPMQYDKHTKKTPNFKIYAPNSAESIAIQSSLKQSHKYAVSRVSESHSTCILKKISNDTLNITPRNQNRPNDNTANKLKSHNLDSDTICDSICNAYNGKLSKSSGETNFGLDYLRVNDLKSVKNAKQYTDASKSNQNKKRKIKRKNSNDEDTIKNQRNWDCENFNNFEQINRDIIKYSRFKPQKIDGKCGNKRVACKLANGTSTMPNKSVNKIPVDELNLVLNRDSIINDIKSCLNELTFNTIQKVHMSYNLVVTTIYLIIMSIFVEGFINNFVAVAKFMACKMSTMRYFVYDFVWMRFYVFLARVFHLRNAHCSMNHTESTELFESYTRLVDNVSDNKKASEACIKSVTMAENGTNIEFDKEQDSTCFDNFEQFNESPRTLYGRIKFSLHKIFYNGVDKDFDNYQHVPNRDSINNMLLKIDENLKSVKNMMFCDYCSCLHRRYDSKRPVNCARFCSDCATYHDAKENDLWIESSLFGFRREYFTLLNGKILNITEWLQCRSNELDFVKPNEHHVSCKLLVDEKKIEIRNHDDKREKNQ